MRDLFRKCKVVGYDSGSSNVLTRFVRSGIMQVDIITRIVIIISLHWIQLFPAGFARLFTLRADRIS